MGTPGKLARLRLVDPCPDRPALEGGEVAKSPCMGPIESSFEKVSAGRTGAKGDHVRSNLGEVGEDGGMAGVVWCGV